MNAVGIDVSKGKSMVAATEQLKKPCGARHSGPFVVK